ncbi:zinc-binding dehydrogenase [Nonomuraea basaltis]|nr:zinc-binding dehydrogenase [Nonomuraea basaltis]
MRLVEEPVPQPRAGEARVKVIATEVNFTDALLREGVYPGGPEPPFTPGYDLVGVVDDLGAGVQGVQVGERVAALTVHGAYADYVCLPADTLVPVPGTADSAEAVTLILSYMTAYQLLYRAARVRTGERVLVQGAAGAVGRATLQLGRLAGWRMYGTGRGDEECAIITGLGGTAIDITAEHSIRRLRAGGGVDVALDGIGGWTGWQSFRALRPQGRLVLFGHYAALSSRGRRLGTLVGFYLAGAVVFAASLLTRKRATTYRIARLRDRFPEEFREDLSTLFKLLAKGEIRPVVADRLPLEEAVRAHERLRSGHLAGKQVLLCGWRF